MSCPSVIAFDVAAFRAAFPAFSNATTYPDALLDAAWAMATAYVSPYWPDGLLTLAQRTLCLQLMTAHLQYLQTQLLSGGTIPNVVTESQVDKVRVSLQAPPASNEWQWWLNTSPYGQQLRALLQLVGAGGLYVGGRPELGAYRKVGGSFR